MQKEIGKKMNCPKCEKKLRKIQVKVEDASQKVTSYQCNSCDYFSFEPISSQKVIEELRESPLKIRQKIINLSGGRLGTYFNKNIIRSLNLHSGDEIDISIPKKGRLIIDIIR